MQEMQEVQIRFLGQEDPLEEEVAIHPSFLAWRIPWGQKELGRTEASEHAHAWRCGRDLIAGAGDKRNGMGKGRISLSGDFGQVQVLAAEKCKKVIERLCCAHPTASQG